MTNPDSTYDRVVRGFAEHGVAMSRAEAKRLTLAYVYCAPLTAIETFIIGRVTTPLPARKGMEWVAGFTNR